MSDTEMVLITKDEIPAKPKPKRTAMFREALESNKAFRLSTSNEKSVRSNACAFARANRAKAHVRKVDGYVYIWFEKDGSI